MHQTKQSQRFAETARELRVEAGHERAFDKAGLKKIKRASEGMNKVSALRLLLMAHFTMVALLANPTLAAACSCIRSSDEQHFAQASSVFVAHVVRSEEAIGLSPYSPDKPEKIIEASFTTVEILKGQPPISGKVKSKTWDWSCAVLLYPAVDYLIFLQGNDFITACGGSRSVILQGADEVTTKTRKLLEGLRALQAK